MERFKKLLEVYPYKDIQHFLYLLTRIEEEGMDIRAARTVAQDFIRNKNLENRRGFGKPVKDPERIIPLGISNTPCPDCKGKMQEAIHTDVENNKVRIAKCKSCQFSMIVES